MFIRFAIVVTLALSALFTSCGGGINPTLGARLIYEQEIADNLKAQIILAEDDILEFDDL
jgi:hypothetical protein